MATLARQLRGSHRLVPLTLSLLACVGLSLLGGCGKDHVTSPSGPALEAQVWDAVEASGLLDDELFPTGEFPLAGAGGASDPVAARRSFTHVDYVQQFVFGDTVLGVPQTAIVKVCDYLKGELQIVQQYAPQDPTPADLERSPAGTRCTTATGSGTRLVRRDATQRSGWRVVNVSSGFTLSTIISRRHMPFLGRRRLLETHALPVSEALPIDSLLHVSGSGPFTLTARTTHDDDVVWLHDALGSRRLPPMGTNTYSGSLALGAPGLRTFTVEALPESVVTVPSYLITQEGWTYTIAVDP
jgi:hypothetical protein